LRNRPQFGALIPSEGAPNLLLVHRSNVATEDGSLAPEPKPQDKIAGDYSLLPQDAAHWALFLDLDGTLIDIADAPDSVRVPEDLPPLLDRLRLRLDGALAVISGRPISDIDRLFAPYRFAAAGLHGLQLRLPDSDSIVASMRGAIEALRTGAKSLVNSLPGTILEDKGATLAMHYRAAPEHREALRKGAAALIAQRPDLHVLSGKMVLEIKPRGVAKGYAVKRFAALPPFAGRTPVFVGDDVTDRDGFKTVRELGGRAVLVGDPKMAAACLVLPNPSAVRAWLARVAIRLEKGA
jgi:trehalose 6-phosphate phosphatase